MSYVYDATPPLMLVAVYLCLLIWALAAYSTACVTGARALMRAYDGAPARPGCIIAHATRWVFGLSRGQADLRPRDFIGLGVFVTVLASAMRCALLIEQMGGVSLATPPDSYAMRTALIHIVSGSALIVLHCGVALRFRQEA